MHERYLAATVVLGSVLIASAANSAFAVPCKDSHATEARQLTVSSPAGGPDSIDDIAPISANGRRPLNIIWIAPTGWVFKPQAVNFKAGSGGPGFSQGHNVGHTAGGNPPLSTVYHLCDHNNDPHSTTHEYNIFLDDVNSIKPRLMKDPVIVNDGDSGLPVGPTTKKKRR